MSLIHEELSPEVEAQIAELQQIMSGDDLSPKVVRGAWEKYLGIKQATLTSQPLDRIVLGHVQSFVEAARLERPIQINSNLSLALLHLGLDTTGIEGRTGALFDGLDAKSLKKAKAFVGSMKTILDG